MTTLANLARLVIVALVGFVVSPPDARAVPETMAAAAIDRGGGPEVLSIHRLPVPKPKAGEVLVAVHVAGVGVWEVGIRQHPPDGTQFPLILGSDGEGTVAAVGAGVRGFKVGDKVYGAGAYAEYVAVRSEYLAHVPKGISFTEAGALAISARVRR